jgi:hypothetical protein
VESLYRSCEGEAIQQILRRLKVIEINKEGNIAGEEEEDSDIVGLDLNSPLVL